MKTRAFLFRHGLICIYSARLEGFEPPTLGSEDMST
jgi:hypothetical protein